MNHINAKDEKTKKYSLTSGKRIYIDSFDGAEHLKTQKAKLSLVFFSTQGTSKDAIILWYTYLDAAQNGGEPVNNPPSCAQPVYRKTRVEKQGSEQGRRVR